MKRAAFIILFIAAHLIFIIAHIDKNNRFIKSFYKKQECEKQKKNLTNKKQELLQKLFEMKKRSNIKRFAKNSLNMGKVKLKQIKKLTQNG